MSLSLKQAATAVSSAGVNPSQVVAATGGLAGALQQAASGVNTKSAASASSTLASGLGNLPGGAGAAGALKNLGAGAKDKIGALEGKLSGLKDSASAAKDKLKGMNNKLGGALDKLKDGIASLATAKLAGIDIPKLDIAAALSKSGLPSGIASQLESQLSAISSGGGVPVSMPVIAINTTDRQEITAAIDNLLGDPSIPPPNMLGEVSEEATSELESTNKITIEQLQEIGSAGSAYTQAASKASKAYAKFEKALHKLPQGDPQIEALREEALKLVQISDEKQKIFKDLKAKYKYDDGVTVIY